MRVTKVESRVAAEKAVVAEPVARAEPSVEAAPPVRTVRLSVNARPWARVRIDGREVGVTPLADLPVAPGRHRVRAELPDGRSHERVVEVGERDLYLSFP